MEVINKTKVNNAIAEVVTVLEKHKLNPLERHYARCKLLQTLEAKQLTDGEKK